MLLFYVLSVCTNAYFLKYAWKKQYGTWSLRENWPDYLLASTGPFLIVIIIMISLGTYSSYWLRKK